MRPVLAVLAAAAALFCWNVGGYDLWAPDEPYFAEGAREMLVDGHWWVPHVNGTITTDKPPLFFWLIAVASAPLGEVSSWTARLPSILAGLGTVALIVWLASRDRTLRSGAIAGGVFALTYLPWDKARTAQIDGVLCFLITGALAAFAAWRGSVLAGSRAGLIFWALAGAAVLAKGPVGVLVPLGIVLATLAWDRDLRSLREFAPIAGPLAFFAIVAAWIAGEAAFGEPGYSVVSAARVHVLDRALEGMHHRQPFWYYARVLPVHTFPWAFVLPGAVLLAWRRRALPEERLALLWAVFPVLFFSIWTEKRDLYILPAYPAFAILLGRFFEDQLDPGVAGPGVGRRWLTWGLWATVALLAIVGAAAVISPQRLATAARFAGRAVGWTLLAGSAVAAFALTRRRGRLAAGAIGTGVGAAYLAAAVWLFPALNGVKSVRPFAEQVAAHTAAARAAGERVVAYRLRNVPEAMAFYGGGLYTVEVGSSEALAEAVRCGAFVASDDARFASIPEDLRERAATVLSGIELTRWKLRLDRFAPEPGELCARPNSAILPQ